MELNMRISAYLPAIVRRHLEMGESMTVPDTHSSIVVSMFADVSGFTAMTESLAARGPKGAEVLGKYLNSYFEQMLRLISSEGGDVFKFAGDALIVFWPENKEDTLDVLVRRCIQCALRIQQHLRHANLAPPDEPEVVLSIKMGIGVGRATIAHLGGECDGATSRMEYVGVGPALIQAFGAEHHATSGDVICSPECWRLVSSSVAGQVISDGFVRVSEMLQPLRCQSRRASFTRDDVQLQRRMQQYVSRAVWPYLDAAEEFWGSELRDVTVLFINLGFGEDDLSSMLDTTSVHKLQAAFAVVQRSVYDYEGTINKFLVDDKGSTAIAVFGMPPVTHENDPIRGILASLAICAALAPLGLKASVGITSGQAFCGVVGHQGNRREYTVLGDTVNLAARLMQRAKSEFGGVGGVITDERTKLSTQDVLHYEDRKIDILVKGKKESIRLLRPYPRMSTVLQHHMKRSSNGGGQRTINVLENIHIMQVRAARRRLSAKLAQDDDDEDNSNVPPNAAAAAIQTALVDKVSQMNLLSPTGAFLLEGDIGLGKTSLVRSTLRETPRVIYATATPFTARQEYVIFAEVLTKCYEATHDHEEDLKSWLAKWIASGVAPQTHWLDHLHVLNDILDDIEFEKPSNNNQDQHDDAPQEKANWFVSFLAADLQETTNQSESSGTSPRPSLTDRESLWCPSELDAAGMLILSALYAISRSLPLVVVLDNAMYMDEKSWILTISIAKYFTNCTLVVITRPPSGAVTQRTASSAFRKQLRALKELESTTACVMGRMQPAQIETLAMRILHVAAIPTELGNLLVSRSQGNPFFLHELIKEMRLQGVLQLDDKTASCELRMQVAWGDKANAIFCFGCQADINIAKDRLRCKACGFVFCVLCAPKQCYKKLAGQSANDTPMRHCKTCYGMTRGRRPSFERSASDSKCLTASASSSGIGSSAVLEKKQSAHRKALSFFVQHSDMNLHLKQRVALVAPRTVKSVLTTLLDQLTVSQYMLMKTASIVGSPFDVETVKSIYPIKDHLVRFDHDLEELTRLSMVQPMDIFIGGLKEPLRTSKFEFCHGFMQDVIRSQMLSVQCEKLETRLADFREVKDKAMRQQFFEKLNNQATTTVVQQPSALHATADATGGRALAMVLRLKTGMVHVKKQASMLSHFRLGGAAMWKKRWAVLHNTRLVLQYDTSRGGRSTWMELKGARVSTCDMTHDPAAFKYHCLQVDVQEWCRNAQAQPESLGPRTFILGVETAHEMGNWIYMIKYAIESLKNR
ncbi:unnamed protein product [Aphanomyces euteiches]|nr:hypothetical protein Ae201684P_018552 [Aphanomyces euteiches]